MQQTTCNVLQLTADNMKDATDNLRRATCNVQPALCALGGSGAHNGTVLVQMWEGEPSPGADVAGVSPVSRPGADVGGMGAVPAQSRRQGAPAMLVGVV